MGQRIIHKEHICSVCGHIPEDLESVWEMGGEIWCESCCNDDNESKEV